MHRDHLHSDHPHSDDLDRDALHQCPPTSYVGWDIAAEQLPHFGLSWELLAEVTRETGLPAADLGSCISPYPVEAALRGIPVIPIDMRYGELPAHASHRYYVDSIIQRMHSARILPTDHLHLAEVLDQVSKSRLACSADEITVPDRSFCIVSAHDCVPKHSKGLDHFITRELPEILRVTDQAAYIYPFAVYRTNKADQLVEAHALYQDEAVLARVEETAKRLGFCFAVRPEQCGAFLRTVDLGQESF